MYYGYAVWVFKVPNIRLARIFKASCTSLILFVDIEPSFVTIFVINYIFWHRVMTILIIYLLKLPSWNKSTKANFREMIYRKDLFTANVFSESKSNTRFSRHSPFVIIIFIYSSPYVLHILFMGPIKAVAVFFIIFAGYSEIMFCWQQQYWIVVKIWNYAPITQTVYK